MINQELLYGVAKLLVGENFDIPSSLAFGSDSGTLSSADIMTSGEFDRNVLDSVYRDEFVAKFSGSRSSAEANNEVIRNIGLHNSNTLGSSSNLMANTLISSLVHTTSFDIEIEFWIRVQ